MKYFNLPKQIAVVAIASLMFAACSKAKTNGQQGDVGQTFVKILGGADPFAINAKTGKIDFITTPQTILVADIRRDVPNNAELNKTVTVVVTDDNAAVAAADPSYVILPSAWYTIGSEVPKVGGSGGTWTFTMKPGEFGKQIYITIPNAQLLDAATTYALGFTITTVDAGAKISKENTVVMEIGAKNKYDGIYKVTGLFQHPTYGPGAGQTLGTPAEGLLEVAMVTTGANTCNRVGVTPDGDIGGYTGFIFFLTAALGGPGYTGFSNVYPAYSMNPSTNVVTVVPKPSSPNTVTFVNNGSSYSPGTKTF